MLSFEMRQNVGFWKGFEFFECFHALSTFTAGNKDIKMEFRALEELYLHGKITLLGVKPGTTPLFPIRISHGLTPEWNSGPSGDRLAAARQNDC